MNIHIPIRGIVVVGCAWFTACSGTEDPKTTPLRDSGVIVTERDGGPRDAGPRDGGIGPCGLYAHEDSPGTCTSSVSWAAGPPVPGARDHHATTIHEFSDGPYLMISGGAKDSFSLLYNNILRLKLSPAGRPIGSWEEIGTLPGNISGHTMFVHNNYVYVTGGANMSGRFDTVVSAPLTPGGVLGEWQNQPRMPVGVWHHQSFIRGDYVYVVGGQSGNEIAESAVHRARFNADASLSEWEPLTPLPTVRSHHGAIATDDGVYVLGGLEDSDFRAEVLFGRFEADGTITEWINVGVIPGSGLATPSVGIVGNRIFVIAGLTGDLEFVGTVLSAEIQADGTVSPLVEINDALPEGRGHVHQLPSLDGRIYIGGGRSGQAAGIGRYKSLDSFFVGTIR